MEIINFKQVRSVGEILNTSSAFIRSNLGGLLKPVLMIAGLPTLIGGILYGQGYESMISNIGSGMYMPGYSPMGSPMFLGMMLMWLGMLLFFLSVNVYIKNYVNQADLSVSGVWGGVKKYILKSMGLGFWTMAIVMVAFMFFLFPGIYVMVPLTFSFLPLVMEDAAIFESIGRAFKLVKGQWWRTFGLLLVLGMICYAIIIVIMLPLYAILGISLFSSLQESANDPTAISGAIGSGMSLIMAVMIVPNTFVVIVCSVVIAVKYYSMVEELDGSGDLEAIDSLRREEGNTAPATDAAIASSSTETTIPPSDHSRFDGSGAGTPTNS